MKEGLNSLNKLFSKLGGRIEKSPFKVLFITMIIFAIMIAGAIKRRFRMSKLVNYI